MKKKILCVIGTRPEVIKMAPIIMKLREDSDCALRVLSTSQHRQMLDQMLDVFEIKPDIDLNLMKSNQSLPELTSKLPLPLHQTLLNEQPDFILAQGDTTTAFMVSLASFYLKIPFGHVEAGLRTGNLFDPFPEEMNRSLISRLSTLHFAPTELAKMNLQSEGCLEKKIFVTGNTVIDSLNHILKKDVVFDLPLRKDKKLILVTTHRRENFGKLEEICQALRKISEKNKNVQILLPVHPNPQVSSVIKKMLGNCPGIQLTDPLPYKQFVKAMELSYFIISDSGGVQEEAPALGKPVLVIRDTTERPEGVNFGASKIIGTKCDDIFREAQCLLDDPVSYQKMILGGCPYGDGRAAERIVSILKDHLGIIKLDGYTARVRKMVGLFPKSLQFLGFDKARLILFYRYFVSGVSSVIVQFSVLYSLVEGMQMNPTTASGLSFIAGCIVNYLLLYYWTFNSRGSHLIVVYRYSIVTLSTFLLNLIVFWVMTEILHMWYLFSQIFATALLAILSLIINGYYTFAKSEENELGANGGAIVGKENAEDNL